jgi:tellurite resistance protein TerC
MPSANAGGAALLAAFASVVVFVLALDLGVLHRRSRAPTSRQAILWSAAWIALALGFGAATTALRGGAKGAEFFTSYLVEKALSVDNLVVMSLVLRYFRVSASAERKVLSYGVVGAIVMRGVLIAAGSAIVARFHAVTYVLGALLAAAGAKLLRAGDCAPAFAEGPLHRAVRRVLPVAGDSDGERFFARRGGVLHATPLLLALVTIEAMDLVFAMDSIPAVFGVTADPFIAFTSNAFAVLGLRALYAVVALALERARFLKVGLAIVLVFVGVKMLASWAFDVPAPVTLVAIVLAIGAAIMAPHFLGDAKKG